MTTLADLFPPDRVLHLKAADHAAVAQQLTTRAAAALPVPLGTIAAALAAREELGSTGVGGGIAIPHAHLPSLPGIFTLFAKLDRPVDWNSIDRRPVDLVFLLLSPAEARTEHLATLAMVTRRLRDPAASTAIRHAATVAEMRERLIA